MSTSTATPASIRHDIDNIADEVIIVEQPSGPERFTRALHPTRVGALSAVTFRRVDGGYNASAIHLAERGFVVEQAACTHDGYGDRAGSVIYPDGNPAHPVTAWWCRGCGDELERAPGAVA